jgi:hypothetical protein
MNKKTLRSRKREKRIKNEIIGLRLRCQSNKKRKRFSKRRKKWITRTGNDD